LLAAIGEDGSAALALRGYGARGRRNGVAGGRRCRRRKPEERGINALRVKRRSPRMGEGPFARACRKSFERPSATQALPQRRGHLGCRVKRRHGSAKPVGKDRLGLCAMLGRRCAGDGRGQIVPRSAIGQDDLLCRVLQRRQRIDGSCSNWLQQRHAHRARRPLGVRARIAKRLRTGGAS
jgi:hypothetical protein